MGAWEFEEFETQQRLCEFGRETEFAKRARWTGRRRGASASPMRGAKTHAAALAVRCLLFGFLSAHPGLASAKSSPLSRTPRRAAQRSLSSRPQLAALFSPTAPAQTSKLWMPSEATAKNHRSFSQTERRLSEQDLVISYKSKATDFWGISAL